MRRITLYAGETWTVSHVGSSREVVRFRSRTVVDEASNCLTSRKLNLADMIDFIECELGLSISHHLARVPARADWSNAQHSNSHRFRCHSSCPFGTRKCRSFSISSELRRAQLKYSLKSTRVTERLWPGVEQCEFSHLKELSNRSAISSKSALVYGIVVLPSDNILG